MRIILFGLFTFIIGLSATSQTLDFAFPFRNDHRPENQALSSVYPAKSYGSVQDSEGNQYVYGTIKDTTDINPGPDSLFLLQPYPSLYFGLCGFPKAYIVKYSPSNEVVWVRTLIGYSELGQIVIDHNNDLIVTGSWSYGLYTEFSGNETPVFTENNPGSFGFMLKINKDGQIIKRKRFYASLATTEILYSHVSTITSDQNGNYYVGGYFRSGVNFADSLNPEVLAGIRYNDAFYAKYDSAFHLKWVKGFGSKGQDLVRDIKFNKCKNQLLISGSFSDSTLVLVGNTSRLLIPGVSDSEPVEGQNGILLQTDLNGNSLGLHQIRSLGSIDGFSSINSYGDFVFTSPTAPRIIINDTLYGFSELGVEDQLFIIVLDSNYRYKWHFISKGNGGNSAILSHKIDDANNVIVAGRFGGGFKNFAQKYQAPVLLSALNYQFNSVLCDGFLAKYTKTGRLLWARKLAAEGFDEVNSVRLDSLNNIYLTGKFEGAGSLNLINPGLNRVSTTSSPGPQGLQTVANGFFGKYSQCITRTQIRDTICFGSTKAFDGENLSKPGKYMRLKSYNASTQCEVWEELYLHVRPEIQASAGADVSVCSGKVQSLGTDSLAGLSYQWQQVGGSFTSTLARPKPSYTNFSDSIRRYRFALQVTDTIGCQKRDTIQLDISPVLRAGLAKTICPGETFQGYSAVGIYNDTLVSSLGCDSIRTLTLNYDIPNNSIQLSAEFGALAAPDQDSYQWLDCNAGFAPITGETDSSFAPAVSGSYAVRVTKGNCADTSNCLFLVNSEPKVVAKSGLNIFPNPAQGYTTIDCSFCKEGQIIEIFSADGTEVKSLTINPARRVIVEGLPAGIYLLHVQGRPFTREKLVLW